MSKTVLELKLIDQQSKLSDMYRRTLLLMGELNTLEQTISRLRDELIEINTETIKQLAKVIKMAENRNVDCE